MIYLATLLYLASFIFQALAFLVALVSFKRAGTHRLGWLFFSLGLLLMLGRRISPMMDVWSDLHVNMTDAVLSVPISFLLMMGVISIRRAFGELQDINEQLTHAQKLDSLTAALTHAEIFIEGEKEIERSFRTKYSFALLMLDIDHFKQVNDQHGHQCGDCVLKALTCICHNTLRKIDVLGRYGGEEFVAILPGASLDNAREVAERLRKNVSDHLGFASGLEEKKVTISIGVAVFEPTGNETKDRADLFKSLVAQADAAMYHAKNAGRNQVSVFECLNAV